MSIYQGPDFVQHIPRINGDIPSLDEATLDHQRLLERYLFLLLGHSQIKQAYVQR